MARLCIKHQTLLGELLKVQLKKWGWEGEDKKTGVLLQALVLHPVPPLCSCFFVYLFIYFYLLIDLFYLFVVIRVLPALAQRSHRIASFQPYFRSPFYSEVV